MYRVSLRYSAATVDPSPRSGAPRHQSPSARPASAAAMGSSPAIFANLARMSGGHVLRPWRQLLTSWNVTPSCRAVSASDPV